MGMKNVLDLNFGFSDAENYKRRENKDLFNKVFIRNKHLDDLCGHGVSFLVGEKGTGKTAYAVYLSNNTYKSIQSQIRYIRETDYQKFVFLKKEKGLALSDYSSVWKVIILLLMSQQIYEKEGGNEFFKKFGKFRALQKAIDEYYNKAFSPEIVQAIQFVQESEITAKLIAKHAEGGGTSKETTAFSESRFQTNLFYIQRQFELALGQVRLKDNHLLFIDGIDIRPSSIPYDEYLDCIKGLATAIWEVNNDFFPSIRGGGGRMRVVLLIRPDIFESLGLQNQNTKIRDNSVFLDWRTEYANYRTSDLFRAMDHLIASQQSGGTSLAIGKTWDYYFPWKESNPRYANSEESSSSFIDFLRWSYYRPRDIITMLGLLQDLLRTRGVNRNYFTASDFNDSEFRRRYSDYLLGEVKDHLVFYYGLNQYELFLKFFEYLNGSNYVTYQQYLDAFKNFRESPALQDCEIPKFMTNSSVFLQFLYDLNILSYIEKPIKDKPYIRWCFRERSFANISPKVKEGVEYQIFYGLSKSLNVGQKFSRT